MIPFENRFQYVYIGVEISQHILKRKLYNDFGGELDILVRNLEPGTRENKKVLALKRKLEVSDFTRSQKYGSVDENSEPTHRAWGRRASSRHRLTELELFRIVLLIPRLLSITTNNRTTSASSRIPENPVKSWEVENSTVPKSFDRLHPLKVSTIKLFLRAMEQINNQRLNPFDASKLEGWVEINVWDRLIDPAFDRLSIDLVRGEGMSMASSDRKNLERTLNNRKKIGRSLQTT
ncbi:17927_t:CDS:2 [Funneliformis caledonium]|uniref:17927_t:CDS:1 n=1 Tax=Funneliformis caledonium TaxID=1117310 RepID=A0A9N9FT55_9GLOM|nr:17927_t:CDS:2 [Funneliformis caledonium]